MNGIALTKVLFIFVNCLKENRVCTKKNFIITERIALVYEWIFQGSHIRCGE